uniref:NADH dehydrogenase subunit 4 n=2 Tax=Acrobeloides nanus TaxID=290746 RepID=A0A914C2Y7_9BILA
MLRHHKWRLLSVIPLVILVIGPTTIGVITSGLIALTFATADKSINCWHSMILGCSQTAFIVLFSFIRILATL